MSTRSSEAGEEAPRAPRVRSLTPSTAKAQYPLGKTVVLWDRAKGAVPGFGLRILSTGGRSYILRVRASLDGVEKQHYRTVGKLQEFYDPNNDDDPCGVALARDRAREMYVGATREQRDPRRKTAPQVAPLLMDEAFAAWLEDRRVKGKPRESTLREYARLWRPKRVKGAAHLLALRPVRAVTPEDIDALHLFLLAPKAKAQRPYLANRAVRMLSAFFRWCERKNYRERSSNPCRDIEFAGEVSDGSAGRSLTAVEYASLGSAFDLAATVGFVVPESRSKSCASSATAKHITKRATAARTTPVPSNPVIVNALLFLAVTGWRESEALVLRWADVSDTLPCFASLKQTKSGPSVRALGAPARAILDAQRAAQSSARAAPLEQDSVQPEPIYVFENLSRRRPIRETRYVWEHVKRAAKISGRLRLHDLRHSFATVARDECKLDDDAIISRLLGHRVGGQTAKYGNAPAGYISEAAEVVMSAIAERLNCEPFKS